MYGVLKSALLSFLRAPEHPPEAPAGSHASVAVFRASPRFLAYKLAVFAIGAVLVGLAELAALVATLVGEQAVGTVVVVLFALAIVVGLCASYFAIRIDYDLRYYVVTDRSLRVRHGAWTVREQTLTYANVQNLRIVQGPIQRLFGISDLRVDTAGGGSARPGKGEDGGHHATLAGIENAQAVRDLVLSYVKTFHKDSGLGDLDDVRAGAGAAALDPRTASALATELEALRDSARGLRLAAEAR